jgi:hypothetical protein
MSKGTAGGQGNAIMQKRGFVSLCEQLRVKSGIACLIRAKTSQ